MSTTTCELLFTNTDSGERFDPDDNSVLLSDSTGSYGVKNNADDSVVVADGVAMTKISTGVYQYSWTDPLPDLTYTAYFEFDISSEAYRAQKTVIGSTSGALYSELDVNSAVVAVKTALGGTVETSAALLHVRHGQINVMKGLDTRMNPPRVHTWSFLHPEVSMTFSATSTGTASGQGTYSSTTEHTTLTATASAFDDSMIGHNLTFTTSEEAYEIVAVTSTTIVVLEGDASAEASGDTFSIDCKGYHDAPTGFRGIKVPPVWAYSASGNRYRLERVSPAQIRAMWRDSVTTGYTRYWSLEAETFDSSASQTYRFLVAPVPIEDMVASMQIYSRVADPAAGKFFPGGEMVSMAIRDAALAEVELISGGTRGVMAEQAQTSLWAAIDADKQLIAATTGPERLRER